MKLKDYDLLKDTFFHTLWFKLPEEAVSKCREFSEKYANKRSDHYIKKRNADPKKIASQAFESKLAEFGALEFARQHCGLSLKPPDLTIYEGSSCNFDADLRDENVNWHVKSCNNTTTKSCGESYIFQYRDNRGSGGRDSLFDNPKSDDVICLVRVDENNLKVQIRGLVKWSYAYDLVLSGNPKSPAMMGIKKVLYYDRLLKKIDLENVRCCCATAAKIQNSVP